MEANKFNEWLDNAVALWQGEPNSPAWEFTDGVHSVQVDLGDGYTVTYSDIGMTRDQVQALFQMVATEEADRLDQLNATSDWEDDLEHGIYGYGY